MKVKRGLRNDRISQLQPSDRGSKCQFFMILQQCLLLAGCPMQLIHKLQKVQNNAARLICRTPKFDHISPVLHTLHWLPVEQRTEYKWILLAFKSVNNEGPPYLF